MNDESTQAQVILEYQAPYADPISVQSGDELIIDESRKTDIPGWKWCTNQAGKSGWVPKSYIREEGGRYFITCDYDSIELSIHPGERLTCHIEESSFIWVTNEQGKSGWVPADHVKIIG